MTPPPPQDFDAWNDPEFSSRWAMREKPASSASPLSAENDQSGRMLRDAALGFGITLAVLALAMALGLMGSGLFAVGDRVLAWLRAGSRWPDDGL